MREHWQRSALLLRQAFPGFENPLSIDELAGLAMELNATFVARSFSGDKNQLIPLIKAAMSHPGFAFIDIISPCVTFNNTAGSTKSYSFVREHIESTSEFDFVPKEEEIEVEYGEGETKEVALFDGSKILLSKLTPEWDPHDKFSAVKRLHEAKENRQILTGLIFINLCKAMGSRNCRKLNTFFHLFDAN